MKRNGPALGHERHNQTSASHCRRDGRVLKIFDWPATRSVYVAIRGEVKPKMAEPCSPRPLHVQVFRHRPGARVRFSLEPREKILRPGNRETGRGQVETLQSPLPPAGPLVFKTKPASVKRKTVI